ncbi:MAG: aquaporin [Candidatus Saccharimonadales bacterium]|jgi:glycerol uptake facilitator-like aquaporin
MFDYKFNKAMTAKLGAEFIGTGILAMVILVMANTTAVSYFIATSAAVTLAAIVMVFAPLSGAHVNPAVTFGMWTARRIGTVKAVAYIVAQVLGGLGAWQLYQYFTNHTLPAKTISFDARLFIAEAVGAAIWAFAFASLVSKAVQTMASAIALGTVVFAAIMIAATASLGYINPAVALAARSSSVVYLVGPLVGGLVGYNLYTLLFEGNKKAV